MAPQYLDRLLAALYERCRFLPNLTRVRLLTLLAVAFFGLFCAARQADAAVEAKLVLSTRELSPTTTFEIRFSEPVVRPDLIGASGAASPIVFRPAVEGSFVWLSERSGVFSPKTALPLGTTYRITLRRGLTGLDDKPLNASLNEVVTVPAMQMTGSYPRRYRSHNATSRPKLQLLFNADIDLESAPDYFTFQNKDGQQIPVRVEAAPADCYFPTYYSSDRTLLTWKQRFENADEQASGPRLNHLVVTPSDQLPVGDDWKLVIRPGLPSTEAGTKLLSGQTVDIGDVLPFAVTDVDTVSNLGDRRIRIAFTKSIAADVADVSRWVSVDPPVEDLAFEISGNELNVRGKLVNKEAYKVTVAAGFPGIEDFSLASEYRTVASIEPIPPRLYFAGHTMEQMATGNRRFPLLSVNVPSVRLQVKQLPPDTAVLALKDYEAYFRSYREWRYGNERYSRVPSEAIAGRDIFQRDLNDLVVNDETQTSMIDWDEVFGAGGTGIALVTAEQSAESGQRAGTQAIVQVTDIGLAWKRSGDDLAQFFAFSHATGQPLKGVTLRLLNDANDVLAETHTDPAGFAELPLEEDGTWLAAVKGADVHVLSFENSRDELALWRFRIPIAYRWNRPDSRRVLLFTERPVYKPGETVHLKGIVRTETEGGFRVPDHRAASLRCFDSRGRKFFEKDVTLSDAGSFAEDINLPRGSLGSYRAEIRFAATDNEDSRSCTHYFSVQEYEPNPFEIKLAAANADQPGAAFELPVSAQYYMGKALSQSKIHWTVEARDAGFRPAGFDDFFFCRWNRYGDYDEEGSELSLNGEGALSREGEFRIETEVPANPKAPQPRDVSVLAEITDLDQKTVSESLNFTRHSSDFYLGIRKFSGVFHEGDKLPVEIVAVNREGRPVESPVETTAKLTRIEWRSIRYEGAGGTIQYRNEAVYHPVDSIVSSSQAALPEGQSFTTNGKPLEFPLAEPGEYLLEVSAKDGGGRAVLTTATVNVAGENEMAWNYRNQFQIDLVPDKGEYVAGEEARLIVKTPIEGNAWVTVERDGVLRSSLVHLSGNAPTIPVALEADDAPNVFVSVLVVRGANDSPRKVREPEFRLGYCQLKVVDPASRLAVSIDPERKDYQPGETVSLVAHVKDLSGQSVPDAEVTLFAVDEGVLSLMGFETPDPYAFFNASRPLAVRTGITLPDLMSEDLSTLSFYNKGYLVGGGGVEGGDRMRKDFPACAFWAADLRTDENGRVTAEFTAPDALTRYRLMAVVQTAANRFGNGQSAIRINKPLMLQPSLPRFANVGDRIMLRAVLHNQSELDGDADLTLELDERAVPVDPKALTRRVHLAAHESKAIDIPVEFVSTGQATWRWKAKMPGPDALMFTDAVQTELKVGYPVPLLTEIHLNRTEAPAMENILEPVNPQLLEGNGIIRVTFSNSRVIDMREAIQELLHYPYGCVEQTTSSTLPWITLRDFQSAIPDLQVSSSQIEEAVQHGVDRLLTMQTSSGGLAYWPGGREPMLWGSAYGGMGIALAKRFGFQIPEAEFKRLCEYLSRSLRNTDEDKLDGHYGGGGPTDRCLAVYTLALAGRAEPGYHELLFRERAKLSPENRALLALAILESNGPRDMVETLLGLRGGGGEYPVFGCAARETAMQLMAWSLYQPENNTVDHLIGDLLGERTAGNWLTTQGNAWGLLALTQYVTHVERGIAQNSGSIVWRDDERKFALPGHAALAEETFIIDPAVAPAPMKVNNPNRRQLFSHLKVEAHPRALAQPPQDRGYSIRRTYQKIADDGTLAPLEETRVGDRVLVSLTIEIRDRANYIAIDDPLPSIFEAVNPEFKSQATAGAGQSGSSFYCDYRELREDRALFFRDHVWPGTYRIQYLARVRAAGTATAPAAKIEEMYHPERFGLTETVKLTSLTLE